jgi:hypothetical protein
MSKLVIISQYAFLSLTSLRANHGRTAGSTIFCSALAELGMDQFFVGLLIRLCRALRRKRSLCRHDEPLFQQEGDHQSNQGKDQNNEKAVLEGSGKG